jgi:hypothetical protein
MATAYKVLGQSIPTFNTSNNLYTVPAGNSAVISTLNVCNLNATNVTFRIAVCPGGAALANLHYIAYDTAIQAQDSIGLTMGITLGATDIITVYASSATMSFLAFGTEIT